MKQAKKIFLVVLAILVLVSVLCACGNTSEEEEQPPESGAVEESPATEEPEATPEPTPEPTQEPTPEPTPEEEAEEETPLKLGTVEGNTYTNTFAGFGCTLGEEWTFLPEEDLLVMAGITAEAVTDEEISQLLQESSVVYDMYATQDDGLCNINVVYEKMSTAYSLLLDEEAYLEASQETIVTALESMGFVFDEISLGTTEFAGNTRHSLTLRGTLGDLAIYEEQVAIKHNGYMIGITFASYGENLLEEMKSAFFAVES